MPGTSQENLETVLIDFLGALRRGDFDGASSLLDPDVTWQGLRDDFVCHGRDEVIDTFGGAFDERREIDALEFVRGGDRIVMGARGPTLTEVAGEPLEGQIYNVFTLSDGRITRIDDYRRRSEALASAGIADDAGWR
jgi:ketosteroid isomerase-like protein